MIQNKADTLLNSTKQVCFITLGCKVNQYESDLMSLQFAKAGYRCVDREDKPENPSDIYIINSCTVTSTGDKKTRQILHRCRRENPNAVIALTGCFVQAFPDKAREVSGWDILCGNTERKSMLSMVERVLTTGEKLVQIDQHEKNEKFESMQIGSYAHKTRAFVKIQDGCNRFCSYCIIPYARGRVRSKPLAELKTEAEQLALAGYQELVLVGINLSSYGQDLGLRLADAVETCCHTSGISRVRLGSLEPELLTHRDLERMAALPQFCPQFHLSLQSGSDGVLRRMNRHYDKAEYTRIAEDIRDCFDNAAITTDIITGFPGETDSEHMESMQFAKDIRLAQIHVFEYSPREGTPAARMKQLPPQVKAKRTAEMLAVKKANEEDFLQTQLGSVGEVLLESHFIETPVSLRAEGYTRNYTPVYIDFAPGTDKNTVKGRIFVCRLTAVQNGHAIGVPVEQAAHFSL